MNWTIEPLSLLEMPAFWQTFKEVLETDFPGYTKKVIEYFLHYLYSEKSFAYYLQSGQKTILIARENKKIIGFAVIDAPYGGVSLCRWLGVKKDYQRKDVGRALVKDWLTKATKEGCHKAEVAGQPEAKEFYSKVGLNLEGKREKSYFGIDQYIFGKVLGPIREEILIK